MLCDYLNANLLFKINKIKIRLIVFLGRDQNTTEEHEKCTATALAY